MACSLKLSTGGESVAFHCLEDGKGMEGTNSAPFSLFLLFGNRWEPLGSGGSGEEESVKVPWDLVLGKMEHTHASFLPHRMRL